MDSLLFTAYGFQDQGKEIKIKGKEKHSSIESKTLYISLEEKWSLSMLKYSSEITSCVFYISKIQKVTVQLSNNILLLN